MSPFDWLNQWFRLQEQPYLALGVGVALLLVASELVVLILGRLEDKNFGVVHLGTLFTPLCTGFPNLMLGMFGQTRLQGDLVIHLNIGNNLANTTLVTGTIMALAGPLLVTVAKGSSKKARRARADFHLALLSFWLGAVLLFECVRDGVVTREDGLKLVGLYFGYQLLMWMRRGTPPKKKRLPLSVGLSLLLLLVLCALLISFSVDAISLGMESMGALIPGASLGMVLGLLTVLPESFLLLRLARKQGSLGLTGLVGDCLVSIPLVVGVSSLIAPITTAPIHHWRDAAARPFLSLAGTMFCFTLLSFRQKQVPRKVGLLFCGLYAMVWWLSS
ncbi:Sodium/calcium exchanger protein [Sulfidibacter corallicola]|uniref:Sodium/calcium exchanger membrane region domain-containing protein n=1 Tax=Sulfidibacter corallicola TaxID=2818388 RepID=A0A8A4TSD9_SULCO|nr:hypothetical protein [Sulfidibacter corallicola]QTD51958.1 hypothetical protein J3U87_05750 [Sulfidibacter corallicola]